MTLPPPVIETAVPDLRGVPLGDVPVAAQGALWRILPEYRVAGQVPVATFSSSIG